MIKVVFVCLGNICRSPMAEFIFKQMDVERRLDDEFEIASRATEKYNELCHAGIHPRTKQILQEMHIPFQEHFSRQIRKEEYNHFDYILAMDSQNISDLHQLLGPDNQHKIFRLLDFTQNPRNIKDPWYTGNFDETFWDITEGCEAFLSFLKNKHTPNE